MDSSLKIYYNIQMNSKKHVHSKHVTPPLKCTNQDWPSPPLMDQIIPTTWTMKGEGYSNAKHWEWQQIHPFQFLLLVTQGMKNYLLTD